MTSVSLTIICLIYGAYAWSRTKCGPTDQVTQYGKMVNPDSVLPLYPRPQMVRGDDNSWMNLNGLWDFNGTTNADHIKHPLPYNYLTFGDTQILVPFPPESCLSGIDETYKHLQYKTSFDDFKNRDKSSTRILLQFGAIDWQSSIYINGKLLGNHTGGYDSFTFDITDSIQTTNNELMVSVYDPSDTGYQPNGKQRISAITNPGGDTYTPTSGIWQTVWVEMVNDPKMYISGYKLYPTLTDVTVNVSITGGASKVTLTAIDPTTNQVVTSANGMSGDMIKLTPSNPKLWDPLNGSPFLYDLNISIDNTDESVMAYFGLRTITLGEYNHSKGATGAQVGIDRPGDDLPGYPIQLPSADYNLCWAMCNNTANCEAWAYAIPGCDSYKNPMCWLKGNIPGTTSNKCRVSGAKGTPGSLQKRPLLNGKPLFVAGWLDQSFWPDGIYTAPTDAGLKSDLTAILDYGYNGVRVHQKVNPERWYYWADKLGIIILQDAVQKYGHASNATIAPFMSDLKAMIEGKFNHPSIVQWETFNEGDCWEVFDQKSGVSVQDVVAYAQELDPTRLVDTDSGGGANNLHIGDVNDIHDYPNPGDPQPYNNSQYAMIGEYGGIGCWVEGKEWANGCYGYEKVGYNVTAFEELYIGMTQKIISNAGDLSVVIYTQITDVENECDGYLNYDRSAKFDATQMQAVSSANKKMIASMWQD